jgi:PAS domain S-box-containing protein
MNRIVKEHFSFLPVPILIAAVAVFYLTVKPSVFFEPAWLVLILNALFVTVVFFAVAYMAGRNFSATGRIRILLLGCGVLAFGMGGVMAGWFRSVPGGGANLYVTINNTGYLVGGIFHFIAALTALLGMSPEAGAKRRKSLLVFGYVGITILMALVTIASLRGTIPHFFVQGVGPTIWRQIALGTAAILFALSFVIFMGMYVKTRDGFLYWYSSALALTVINFSASLINKAAGSPIGWTARFSQYLGGIYLLIAIITAIRSAQAKRISFDNVLSVSFTPEEEKFRALAENSPDAIERFDRGMRHIYVNRVSLSLYGKPAGSIIGKTIEEARLPGPDVGLLKETLQRVFETAQPVEVEHYVSTQNGIKFYQSRCVPEFDVDGTVVNVLVVSRDLTERKRAEEALQQRTLELQHLTETLEERVKERTEELANVISQIISTQENERRRISYDLHDNVWQELEIIKSQVEQLSSRQDEMDRAAFQQKSRLLLPLIRDTVARIRSMQGDLWPFVLDDIGILATLEWYCREFRANHPALTIEKHVNLGEDEVPAPVKIVIYRVLQESLNNIKKHSKASHVHLSLTKDEHHLKFAVRDDGIGFDPRKTMIERSAWGGLGLLNMKQRTELAGGLFQVESARGQGTTVAVLWPLRD